METVEGTRLHYGDFIVIVAYFAFVLFIGLWVCIKIFFFFLKIFYVHRPNIIFAAVLVDHQMTNGDRIKQITLFKFKQVLANVRHWLFIEQFGGND